MEHFEVLNPKSPRQMSSKYILLWFCMVKSFIAPLSSEEIAFVSDKDFPEMTSELNGTSPIIEDKASKYYLL